MSEWVGIEEGNDWCAIFYTYADERAPRNALRLKRGDELELMFPDGVARTCKLLTRVNETSYGDMGHTYSATQVRFGVEVETHGVAAWVPLERLKLRYESVPRLNDPAR